MLTAQINAPTTPPTRTAAFATPQSTGGPHPELHTFPSGNKRKGPQKPAVNRSSANIDSLYRRFIVRNTTYCFPPHVTLLGRSGELIRDNHIPLRAQQHRNRLRVRCKGWD